MFISFALMEPHFKKDIYKLSCKHCTMKKWVFFVVDDIISAGGISIRWEAIPKKQ